jgi:endonuclease/exonuclease/phosphatase (EEP) superfamily protein YafD
MVHVNDVDLAKLEAEFAVSRKEKMLAHNMLQKVAKALSLAEAASADASLIDRLDMMQMVLTQVSKENVCTNAKCPHYNKKCKMR